MTENIVLRVLSLGAGVQSTALAMLAERGEFGDKPDFAVFSDTRWEPSSVYENLKWIEENVSYPVYRVTKGNLRQDVLDKKNGSGLPFFTENGGRLGRGCTLTYKIEPKRKFIRMMLCDKLGIRIQQRIPKDVIVEQWFGISLDEVHRMRTPDEFWMTYRYPLIYDKPMRRGECLSWMARNYQRIPPRSACIGCPFHSDGEWRRIKSRPEEWADAVDFDEKIRINGVRSARERCYIHWTAKPLTEVDLSTAEDHGQMTLFGAEREECHGECGV